MSDARKQGHSQRVMHASRGTAYELYTQGDTYRRACFFRAARALSDMTTQRHCCQLAPP